MITLYFSTTPNGYKPLILLEECGMPYRIRYLNTFAGEQFQPGFLAVSPNGKIPAICDGEPGDGGSPVDVFESGAILTYLAEKAGRFLPLDARSRADVFQWLFWQVGGLGPVSGQAGHFTRHAPIGADSYPKERFHRELRRLYAVLDHALETRGFIAGDYSIADIAIYPWVRSHAMFDVPIEEYPAAKAWLETIAVRPAVRRAYDAGEAAKPNAPVRFQDFTPEQQRVLFACTSEDMRRAFRGELETWGHEAESSR